MSSTLEQELVEAFSEFEIIDCHEHLPPEKVYLQQGQDACTLFGHYCRTDLITAGMSPRDYERMLDTDLPLEYRWNLLRPYLDDIRFGTYARAAFIAAKEFYGFDDINDDNYVAISEAMQANLKPGIYQRVLGDKCKIKVALTQAGRTDYQEDPLLVPLMPARDYTDVSTWEAIQRKAGELGMTVNSLDDYVNVMEAGVVKWKREGAVGLKTVSEPTAGPPDRAEAMSLFETLRCGSREKLSDHPTPGVATSLTAPNPLRDYLRDEMLKICARQDMPMAVHAGMWGDFRNLDSQHIIPSIMRHPQTRFDLYHMGMPEVRQTGIIGKNFPNVWLNLCWTHIVSAQMTRSALDEYLDLVPVNKIFAFGGDYHRPVEKVYGHLTLARQNIAWVLARRIEAGVMTEDQALAVARKWFWDNPIECYKLKV